MAAPLPVLSKHQQNQSIRANTEAKKKVKPQFKNVLRNPYTEAWPFVPEDIQTEVLNKLKECVPVKLQPVFHSNKERKIFLKQKKENQLSSEQSEEVDKRKQMRNELSIGINTVTKALEKDRLRLVIVSRETKIKILTQHLLPLVAVRNCPAICLPNLSENIAQFTGIQSISALGFKKMEETSLFDEFVEYVSKKAPPVKLSWLPEEQQNSDEVNVEIAESKTELHEMKPQKKEPSDSKKDYSYLYVYKKENELGDDFISLKDSGTMNEEDYFPTETKKLKLKGQTPLLSFKYRGVDVGAMKRNENRKRKKKGK
ncbi:hypothetical protein SNE40_001163 [Patella caerulea]|uniref:Ribosomal protein L7Ae/L30e/S12e/Gadd45 domain-containing protein n=1 Tax=Patella caerulea TaxID=87958 RepID=A0AAN8KDG4_PATCE